MQGREQGFLQQIVGKSLKELHRADSIPDMENPWHEDAAGPSSPVQMKADIITGHLTLENVFKKNEQV